MLELRESDVPVLIVFLIVFPVVVYIVLGKWGDITNQKGKASILMHIAVEESRQAELMTATTNDMVPALSPSKTLTHMCALCFNPATTRCSRCKSVRYCCGKCQIIHWRQGHKQECQQLENSNSNKHLVYKLISTATTDIIQPQETNIQFVLQNSDKTVDRSSVKNSIYFSTNDVGTRDDSHGDARQKGNMASDFSWRPTDELDLHVKFPSNKVGSDHSAFEGKTMTGHDIGVNQSKNSCVENKLRSDESMITAEVSKEKCQRSCATVTSRCASSTKKTRRSRSNSCAADWGFMDGQTPSTPNNGTADHNSSYRETNFDRNSTSIVTQKIDGTPSMRNIKKTEIKRSKVLGEVTHEVNVGHAKIKALFPYEEFVKFFRLEVYDLSPRGLLNYRNSCYANAVLQCITSTKPLVIYLLQRSHSSICRMRQWCLMCELEQHVMLLKECGGPISPNKILYHMHKLNRQIGTGNQEDAHEFLRLLVTCMQSICLDGVGGEHSVDPKLQETTFIQHTFGGRLRSKVRCMRCQQESERYENIMDLTLEIPSWVESLEDALTQFTTPEDLDGDNMYRCRRCASYVRAMKQLSIHEAPNILTFVLKRFQEGKYGKINKCIAFPDMLDMVPYMTGVGDIPPPYALYAVVVHLDTQNASFSGHYVAYVKDFKGYWLRIDDIQVQPVVASQVMCEGAYLLFYTRTRPRPLGAGKGRKMAQEQTAASLKSLSPKTCSSSGLGNRRHGPDMSSVINAGRPGASSHEPRKGGLGYSEDATYSDWSHFTSSDDASFSTESTRDSFSTVECTDSDPAFNPRIPAQCRVYPDGTMWSGSGYYGGCP